MTALCAWCGEPRVAGPVCPECGADYEKAAQIKAVKKAAASTNTTSRKSKSKLRTEEREERLIQAWEPVQDLQFEKKLCLFTVPGMLAFCLMLELVGIGDGFLRIVFGMPVHEMGHAVMGWFSGFTSIPTLWKTLIPNDRGFIAPIVLFGGLCYLINFARLNAYGGLLLLGVFLVLMQFVATLVWEVRTAQMWVTWAGDGVGIMLATALMIGFTLDKRTNWYKGYLRWGFAFIGAAAFADMVVPWWKSLSDISHVPYGSTGGTHTDTFKMMEYYSWQMNEVIHRYVYLSVFCGIVLAVFYISGIKQVNRAIIVREKMHEEEAGANAETEAPSP